MGYSKSSQNFDNVLVHLIIIQPLTTTLKRTAVLSERGLHCVVAFDQHPKISSFGFFSFRYALRVMRYMFRRTPVSVASLVSKTRITEMRDAKTWGWRILLDSFLQKLELFTKRIRLQYWQGPGFFNSSCVPFDFLNRNRRNACQYSCRHMFSY
jgi:hypothetical protein